ncbi:hypothetical protein ACFVH9_08495 [Streptomyces hirsutus]
MSAQSEQERARREYEAAREQREAKALRLAQDNARIDGNNTSGSNGGAR